MSDADLKAIGLQFQADEHADSRAAAARVEDFAEATAAPAVPLTAEQQTAAEKEAQAKQLASVVEAQLPRLAGVAWAIVDRLVVQAAGAEFALTPDERSQLAEATVPVINKYVPESMAWLTTTPEGALALTAGLIYGFKVLAPAAAAPSAAPTPSPETPPAVTA